MKRIWRTAVMAWSRYYPRISLKELNTNRNSPQSI